MNPLEPASTSSPPQQSTQPEPAPSPTTALPTEPVLPPDGVTNRVWQMPPPLPTAEELAPRGEPPSVSKPAEDLRAGPFLFRVTVFLVLMLIGAYVAPYAIAHWR